MVYNGESMFSYLKINLFRFKRKKQPAMQKKCVNNGIFNFFGTRIWAPMLVYRYENPSGYVIELSVLSPNLNC